MSRFLLLCVFGLLNGSTASAGDFIVWMEAHAPKDRVLSRAQRLAGAKEHLSHRELAFPPQPVRPEDESRLVALKKAKTLGLEQWHEFDIERDLSRTLATALGQVDLVRNTSDLEVVVEGLLFQGAAIFRAFNPATFANEADAAAFRFEQPGFSGNLGWSRAMALDPTRRPRRSDVVDASTLMTLRELEGSFKALQTGSLDLTPLMKDETLMLDGREMEVSPGDALDLLPGRHYVHIQRDGVVAGRQVVTVKSGESVAIPLYVTATDLALAKTQVSNGLTTGFPEPVKTAIEAIARHRKGAIFVGALDADGQPVVLPYARGAKLAQNRKGAFILFGGAAFGLSKSKILDNEQLSDESWVPTGIAQMGFEASYSYFCLTAGLDASVPAGNRVTFGVADGEVAGDDKESYVLPQPWLGVGAYILRPFDNSHTLMVAATTEYLFPAHVGYGARVVWGLPFESGNAWFRVTLAGSNSNKANPKWRELAPYQGVSYTKVYLGLNGGGRF